MASSLGGHISANIQRRSGAQWHSQSTSSLLRRRQCSIGESKRHKRNHTHNRARAHRQEYSASYRKGRERISKRHIRKLSDHVRDYVQSAASRTTRHTFKVRLE